MVEEEQQGGMRLDTLAFETAQSAADNRGRDAAH